MQVKIKFPQSTLFLGLVIGGLFFALGELSIGLGSIGGTASPFWLPAGLVVAFSYLFGLRALPGIFFGQFLFGLYGEPGPYWKHLLIAVGNVAEGTLVWFLTRSWLKSGDPFTSVPNFFSLIASSGVGSLVNASLGSLALLWSGSIPGTVFFEVMLHWSIGDLGGMLIVTPFILAWGSMESKRFNLRHAFEQGLLLLAVCGITYAVFGGLLTLYSAPMAFFLLPLLLWSSFRFELETCTLLNALMIGIIIWGTTHGHGPFVTSSATESLILIQVFTSVIIVTSLVSFIVNRDRRRMTKMLRQEADSLEAMVSERTTELVEAKTIAEIATAQKHRDNELLQAQNETLQQLQKEAEISHQRLLHASKMSSLGEMAGGIAHEINNPTSIIIAKASRLKRLIDSHSGDQGKIDKDLDDIILTTERIASIVKGLKTFSRDAENDPFLPTELQALVAESLALCSERIKAKDVQLKLGDIPKVILTCRSTQIAQVLVNLINNAFDAIENLSEKWIKLEVELLDHRLIRFTIGDSGEGIPEAVSQKLMQPFFTTKEVGRGTGLGLSISKGIAEAHGGTLRYNAASKNTTFEFEVAINPF